MSVEAIYKSYIQRLPLSEKLELIKLLINTTFPEVKSSSHAEEKPFNIMDLAGAGKEFAMETDAQEYVNKLRSEWD